MGEDTVYAELQLYTVVAAYPLLFLLAVWAYNLVRRWNAARAREGAARAAAREKQGAGGGEETAKKPEAKEEAKKQK